MKTALTILALCTLASSSLLGCSTESGSVDPADALGRFQHPSGSFSSDSGSAAFSGYASDRAASGNVAMPDGATSASGGTSTTQSLHVLTMTTSNQSQCGEGRKCSCDGSGSFTYSQGSSKLGTEIDFEFDHCIAADGSGFDGKAAIVLSQSPILGLRGGTSNGKPNFLLVAKGTGYDGTESAPLTFALASEAGYVFLSVDLPDGNVVIGVAGDGTAYVKAKEGSWTCNVDDASGYACVSDDGAPAVKVAKTSASNDKPAANAPSKDPPSMSGALASH